MVAKISAAVLPVLEMGRIVKNMLSPLRVKVDWELLSRKIVARLLIINFTESLEYNDCKQ